MVLACGASAERTRALVACYARLCQGHALCEDFRVEAARVNIRGATSRSKALDFWLPINKTQSRKVECALVCDRPHPVRWHDQDGQLRGRKHVNVALAEG